MKLNLHLRDYTQVWRGALLPPSNFSAAAAVDLRDSLLTHFYLSLSSQSQVGGVSNNSKLGVVVNRFGDYLCVNCAY